jgi:hypothetical protein
LDHISQKLWRSALELIARAATEAVEGAELVSNNPAVGSRLGP